MSSRHVLPTGFMALLFAAAVTVYLTSLPVNDNNRFLVGPTALSEEAKTLAIGCEVIPQEQVKPGSLSYTKRYAGVTSRNEHVYRVFVSLEDTCFAYITDKAPQKMDPFEGETVSLSKL